MLQCEPTPCFEQQTQLELDKVGPGAFRIINIDGSHKGTSRGTLADWIVRGYEGHMPLGWYYSDPGASSTRARSRTPSRCAARHRDLETRS